MKRIKGLISVLLIVVMVGAVFAGCGQKEGSSGNDAQTGGTAATESGNGGETTAEDKGTEDAGDNKDAYADSLEIMKLIWDSFPEDGKFSCFGGNNLEDPVMDAPGSFDVNDKDSLSSTLLVPEALQGSIDNAASLVHMMNANTFTGAVIHLKDKAAADAAEEIKKAVTGNQFMCGFPERLVIVTAGDYVIYAFGAGEIINNFKKAAEEKVEGAEVVCDQPME